jgi:hypothetical protein
MVIRHPAGFELRVITEGGESSSGELPHGGDEGGEDDVIVTEWSEPI